MDWDMVIERNAEALRRVLAMLVAMAGLADVRTLATPDWRLPIADCPTLPRRLHNAVLRLLRPAESAARRLVIVAARELAVAVPPPRPRKRKPDPKAAHAALRGLGIAVVLPPAQAGRAVRTAASPARPAGRVPVLPLFDPPRRPLRGRVRTVPPHAAPRILSFDGAAPHRLPLPPSPHDPIDATRLARRLEALARALDDLPGHAARFARWKARRDQARLAAMSDPPLRSAGLSHLNRLASGPPPLAPPQKGEGDSARCRLAPELQDFRLRGGGRCPPPPCGEGLGVGVTAARRPEKISNGIAIMRSGAGGGRMRNGGGILRVRNRRLFPLRAGRPPGQRSRHARGRAHEIHDILADLHHFATLALEAADTS